MTPECWAGHRPGGALLRPERTCWPRRPSLPFGKRPVGAGPGARGPGRPLGEGGAGVRGQPLPGDQRPPGGLRRPARAELPPVLHPERPRDSPSASPLLLPKDGARGGVAPCQSDEGPAPAGPPLGSEGNPASAAEPARSAVSRSPGDCLPCGPPGSGRLRSSGQKRKVAPGLLQAAAVLRPSPTQAAAPVAVARGPGGHVPALLPATEMPLGAAGLAGPSLFCLFIFLFLSLIF